MGKEIRFTASYDIAYEPGTLEAVGYRGGQRVSYDVVKTAGDPVGIRITPDKKELVADGQSLCHAVVEVIDGEGNLVPNAQIMSFAKVEGAATLAAFGTGRPQTTENYTKGQFTSFKGRLLAILRSGYESGNAVLTVSMDGLDAISIEIPVR